MRLSKSFLNWVAQYVKSYLSILRLFCFNFSDRNQYETFWVETENSTDKKEFSIVIHIDIRVLILSILLNIFKVFYLIPLLQIGKCLF